MPGESDASAVSQRPPATTALRRVAGAFMLAIAAGCATLPEPHQGDLASDRSPIRSCAAWFKALDQAVDQAGVRDAGAYRIPGFPYLRTDRFLASFRAVAATGGDRFESWLARLRGLDATARGFELRNLPDSALLELGVAGRDEAGTRSEECAAQLMRHDLSSAEAQVLLGERAQVPDDYSDWQRAVGLYEIVRIPFSAGVERWHEEALGTFRQAREGTAPARAYRRYAPAVSAPMARDQVAGLLRHARTDSLGIPKFSDAERLRLFEAFAPVLEIETTGTHDRFGSLAWRGGPAPEVDVSLPVVYRRLGFTRYGERTLVQLTYTIWFPERPYDHALDPLAGKLDGVVLRVTLTPEGEPLVYDSIHPCGCFHMFFPTPLAQPKPAPAPGEEWALIPATLPAVAPDQRVVLRIASRTHYLLDIAPDRGGGSERTYGFADEDSLRSLPAGEGAWRSAYGPDGLVPGTERGERMLFWPMGIASAGAMRQWGRHATAFLGRRHFDDADLIERRFAIVLR